ncbi:MAG: hypothetical protein IJH38_00285 [Clostridia bacterium]|nr:hypothetical protein [Clostridia bacterium]
MKAAGIDIGTTSVSAVVLDGDTMAVREAWTVRNPGFIPARRPWERLQDIDRVVDTARKLLDAVLEAHPDVSAIGLTSQMHGVAYVDEAGRAVSPLMTWQDGRAARPLGGGESLLSRISARFSVKVYPGYGLLTHLYNLQTGEVPGGAASIATAADCFGLSITGRARPLLHSSNAAGLGLYDLKTHAWRRDILKAFGESGGILPDSVNRFDRLGEYRGIPVSVAIGDNQASFLGAVRCASEELLLNMGTGGQISMLTRRPLIAREIETRPFNEDSFLAVGVSLCGGRAYATLAAFFEACARGFGCEGADPYAAMARFLEEPREEDPMTVDTAFDGTRENPAGRGGISNLSTRNFTPRGLTRGVLEGMVRELFMRYQTISEGLGEERRRIVASGNGMRLNPALRSIAGEMFGMELVLAQNTEEAACGAAIASLAAVGDRTWEEAVGFAR